jgi:hypothetical protein
MTRTLQLAATGMVTLTPGSIVYPNTRSNATFVMMNNPTRRTSLNYPNEIIQKHVAFVLAEERNIVQSASWRAIDLAANQFGYAGWILDSERLRLERDPKTNKIAFDSSMSDIADIRSLNPGAVMEPDFANPMPKNIGPIAAQFFLESGNVYADGNSEKVYFKSAGDPDPAPIVFRNELVVDIELQDADVAFTILSNALSNQFPQEPMRLKFDTGQRMMKIYFGSAPIGVLQQVPDGVPSGAHQKGVDFELYYDISRGGPPGRRPIPHYVGSGPVPGTDRCPPLQNGG